MSTNEHENFASDPSTSTGAEAAPTLTDPAVSGPAEPAAPFPAEPAAPVPEPVEGSGIASHQRLDDRLRPRTGTIVWGVLVLAFCLYTGFQAVAPGSIDGTTFAITAIIGLGLLLLAVGAAVVVRSTRQQKR